MDARVGDNRCWTGLRRVPTEWPRAPHTLKHEPSMADSPLAPFQVESLVLCQHSCRGISRGPDHTQVQVVRLSLTGCVRGLSTSLSLIFPKHRTGITPTLGEVFSTWATSFFGRGSDSKYLRLCGPYSLCHEYLTGKRGHRHG